MFRGEMKCRGRGNIGAGGLFLLLTLHFVAVQGTLYSNGLTRYGRNVCSRYRSSSVSRSIVVTTTNYQNYYSKCGWFGWWRCKKSRKVTGYKYRRAYYTQYDTYLSCCSGWRRSGSTCPTAICRNGCRNGGTCVSPNTCRCSPHWTGSICGIDVNDCSPNNGGCQQGCSNRRGAARTCYCYSGYKTIPYDNRNCTDIDECRTISACSCAGAGPCGARCTNTAGSYRCSCGQGYKLQRSTVCTDINECAVNNGGCSRQCVNYPGGYRCTCPRGFRLVSGKSCTDINECSSNNGNCQHTCRNLFGSHRCSCHEGFNLDSNGRTCSDIDECKLDHGCEDSCSNTIGGYKCSCRKGYQLASDNRTCTDIDECAPRGITSSEETGSLSTCHHICTNVEGSFQCSCRSGYTLMYDKKRCKDIDECQAGHSCEHYCHNIIGSYYCSCKPGYKLSSGGKKCEAQPCENIDAPHHGGMTCSGLVTNAKCSFSCNPGYDLVGPESRTCLPSSRWSGNINFCKVKHCETLKTTMESQTISVPCFTSLGSTCYFGCRRGFLLHGGGEASCNLSSNGGNVSWNTGKFSCRGITTCQPNPCRHGGRCLALNEKDYSCNCEGTGYKGSHCETGYVLAPIIPKLRTKVKSNKLSLLARPSRRLKVSLHSEKGVAFEPQAVVFDSSKIKEEFTVKVDKPGIQVINYILDEESKNDFETPRPSVLFSPPELAFNSSLSGKMFLPRGELPIGCNKHHTKGKFACKVRLLSTAPWMGSPPSTNGIVFLKSAKNQDVPLSLIGFNLTDVNYSRKKMIDAGIAMTSSTKEFTLMYILNGSCHPLVITPNNLLELIHNDAFVSSFMQALSSVAPEWLSIDVSKTNNVFDIQNIAVNVAPDSEQCLGFPSSQTSTLAYYRPTVNYILRIAQNEIDLLADGSTCFAINVCKPGLFINFSKGQADRLKRSLNVFREMENSGLILHLDSIGVHEDKETARFVKGIIWNGRKLRELSPFEYDMWLKGSLDWSMKIPKMLFVSFKMTGEAIIRSQNIDSLFTALMSQHMDMQLKGEAFVNIKGRALKQNFTLKLGSTKVNGQALLGGRNECSGNVQGIFLTLERSSCNLLNKSPLASYLRPIETEPVRLAMLMSLSGGERNKIVNIGEVKRFLHDSISLLLELRNVLSKAYVRFEEGAVVLKNSLQMILQLNDSLNEISKMLAEERINVTEALRILNRIDVEIKHLKSVTDIIRDRCSSNDNATYAELLPMIDEIQAKFPERVRTNLGGEQVERYFHGISFYFRGNLCMGKLCFEKLSTTVDYLSGNSCFSNTSDVSMFRAKGKVLKSMALSQGNILTLPMGSIIEMFFPRESVIVSSHFTGESRLLNVRQQVNVAFDKKQLSFQMQGEVFNKYLANMNVSAKTDYAEEWGSLSFTVDGRMTNYSLLSRLLQQGVINFARSLAQKAAKRIAKFEDSFQRAQQRVLTAKDLVITKQSFANEALREKQKKLLKSRRIIDGYKKASADLNYSLTEFLKVKNRKTCQLQKCNYIETDACMPAVCQKEVMVNYTVPICKKMTETFEIEVWVPKVVQEVEWVQIYGFVERGNCGKNEKILSAVGDVVTVAGGITSAFHPLAGAIVTGFGLMFKGIGKMVDSVTGCDSYLEKIPLRKEKVVHNVMKNFLETRKKIIGRFVCDKQKTETVISGYRPYECCQNGEGRKIKFLDPKCVTHNTLCSINMTILADKIQIENETLFQEFQAMMTKGKQAYSAQLEASKAEVRFDIAARQLELARVRLLQQEFAREAINLTTVQQREKLGLQLGENMKKLESKPLVSVENLTFSVSLTRSSTKTRFPLTAYVRTFKDSQKAIQFEMNFKQEKDSLASASRLIIETVFGTSGSRRRRSIREELIRSKRNENDVPLDQHECLFSQEAHIVFFDIVESMYFSIKNNREIEEAMSSGIRGLENLSFGKDGDGHSSYSDIIQYLREFQPKRSEVHSWKDTLNDVRGFLDVLMQKKNFSECSGIHDCTNFFFDGLQEMYEMEYHPKAIEIKVALKALRKIISGILIEDHAMSVMEEILTQAMSLINKSSDDVILCGKKPTINWNYPAKVVTLLGETVHLVCETESTLEVEYRWIKNGQPLDGASDTILELRNVSEDSEGAYKCQASNRKGSTVSNVTIVIVHQRPHITEQPIGAQKLVGDETFWMVCNSTGVPQPLTEWFFIPDVRKDKNQGEVRLTTTGQILQMQNLTTANTGLYYCKVSNLHGKIQSRMARLDVLRFVPGVPRLAVSLKLKQCVSATSQMNSQQPGESCRTMGKPQQIHFVTYQLITRNMLEHMSWPVEQIDNEYYKPFPEASLSFILNGDHPTVPEGNKQEALNEFSLSRRRMGNSLKNLYSSLENESMTFKWKNMTIRGDKDSLVVGFPPQKCPNGTRRLENGFLCVYCPPGYYEVGNRTCHQCPAGTYQPNDGSTECRKCPFLVSHTELGAVRESQCIDISIPCKVPQTYNNRGRTLNRTKSVYRSGETVVLSCKPGYRGVGNGTLECNEGNWMKSDFYCEKTCFPPWTELKKRCYLVIEASTHRWKEISVECLKLSSRMVTISSEEENAFVGQLVKVYLKEKKLGQVQMWLGLRKTHSQGHFQWVDGSPLKGYTNWSHGEPNNANGRELCTEMLVSEKLRLSKWNDVNCDTTSYKSITVCKKPLREKD